MIANIVDKQVNIFIFRTNIRYKKYLKNITAIFKNNLGILRWNIDFEDVDKVLRIESRLLNAADIIRLLEKVGYHCEELPD